MISSMGDGRKGSRWGNSLLNKNPEMTQQLACFPNHILTQNFSCEAELQELMHQIDVMVNNKKLKWERHVQVLETKLGMREKELLNARNTMDQNIKEMEILHHKLDDVEKSRCEMAQNYEGQLQMLQCQLSKLRNSYEKLQLHHRKQVRSHRTELSPEHESTQFELNRLNQNLEEFKTKSKEWEKQRILYQNQLGTLDRQRKSFAQKCEVFQKQSQKKQLQDCAFTSQSEIKYLRNQLYASQEIIKSSEVIITKLKSDKNEAIMRQMKLEEENQRLLQELEKCQRQCQSLESELSKVKIELQSRDDFLRAVEMERIQMHKELAKYRKHKIIDENTKSSDISHAQFIKLNEELGKKKTEFHVAEQLKTQLHGLDKMRTENSELLAKLHEKDKTLAMAEDKSYLLERQLKTELDLKEKNISKQQGVRSLKEQDNYATYLEKLKCENEKLQNDFIKMQAKLEFCSEASHEKPEGSLNLSLHDMTEIKVREDRMCQQENKWKMKTKLFESARNYTNKNHAFHSESGDITVYSSWNNLSQNIYRDPDRVPDSSSEMAITGYLHHQNKLPPNQDMSSSSLLSHYSQEDGITMSSPEVSFATTAAEKFFQEEDRRAKEFEKILNSHIDEMQNNSKKLLCKLTRFKQTRHV
ncbi:deuterosome assembly protein 1 isoform X2 [Rhinatrema bivittatum]|uniref:deuterosome assembly protein 1 isoform X2 n=1 Tax=Rhinatrema bivittatum TaxID=194408 RepID=UPI0011277644|nr:deuterosome assembly protein 1 isoform X2 [Rhinatrema bivittatum]